MKYPALEPKSELGFKALCFGETATGKTASLATLLLAGQKVRLLSADNNANAGIKAGLALYKINKEEVDLSICVPERSFMPITDMLSIVDNYLKTDIDALMKGKDKFRKHNTGFKNIIEGASEFKDSITGESKGIVHEWGTDTTFVIDSLTVICNEIQLTVTGNKPSTLPEWGAQQGLLKFFLNFITNNLKCNVVLLAHPDKDQDAITGATRIYPSNLGKAMNGTISSNFSDVMYSQKESKKYFWSTEHRTAVCSGRDLPQAENIPQDYRAFFKGV
jgi:hypothetical protein